MLDWIPGSPCSEAREKQAVMGEESKGTRDTWLFSIIKGSRRKEGERKIKHMVGIKNSWREKIERNHSLQKENGNLHSSVLA